MYICYILFLQVDKYKFQVKEGDDNPVAVPISLTIPIGCSYYTNHHEYY